MLEMFQSPLILGLNRHQLIVYTLVMTTAFKFLSLTYRTDHFIWLMEHQIRYTFFGGLSRDLSKFFQRLPEAKNRRKWAFSELDWNPRGDCAIVCLTSPPEGARGWVKRLKLPPIQPSDWRTAADVSLDRVTYANQLRSAHGWTERRSRGGSAGLRPRVAGCSSVLVQL